MARQPAKRKKPERPQQPTPDERLLNSVKGAAGRLGVSLQTVRRLVWSGTLPHVRIGKKVLVPEGALTDYVSGLRKQGGLT